MNIIIRGPPFARRRNRYGENLMRFYRALLHLYPTSFRNEYGEEMAAIFAQRRRDSANALSGAML